MFASSPSSLLFSFNPNPPLLRPPRLRCRAAAAGAGDLAAGPAFPKLFQYLSIAGVSGGVGTRIGIDSSDGGAAADGAVRRGANDGGTKVNAKEKKWSRSGESYLTDDEDPLPLPMTYPDSSPVSPEEIDRRLRCDPQVEVRFFLALLKKSYFLFLFTFW